MLNVIRFPDPNFLTKCDFELRQLRHTKSSSYWCDQQTRRRSACGLHLRWSTASCLNAQVCYTLVDCNLLTPLHRFVLDLSYKLFLRCYAAVGYILSRHIALRAVRRASWIETQNSANTTTNFIRHELRFCSSITPPWCIFQLTARTHTPV